MHIVHISPELAPIAKVGGLADVIPALSKQLIEYGHTVSIIIPKYRNIDMSAFNYTELLEETISFSYEGVMHSNRIWKVLYGELSIYLIDPQNDSDFFDRERLYGYDDDIERFIYFSRATFEFLQTVPFPVNIIHLHDWQTAAIAPLFTEAYQENPYHLRPKIIFSIHNMEHQGRAEISIIRKIDLPTHLVTDPQHEHTSNLLAAGIKHSDYTATVSPRYAKEVLSPLGGRGLEHVLQEKENCFSGILNGIDTESWNPETDPHLFHPYSASDLAGKAKNKKAIRKQLKMKDCARPIITCITRLVPQKGIELIKHALFRSLEFEAQFILLGSSPIPSIQEEFTQIHRQMTDHPHLHLNFTHDEDLSHKIYAAADAIIVPSLFEPCGLTQLIALRYGTIPIVRNTGGLADTVFDLDHTSKSDHLPANGFCFDYPDLQGMNYALDRAIALYKEKPKKWKELMHNAMNYDYSWKQPAYEYIRLYETVLTQ